MWVQANGKPRIPKISQYTAATSATEHTVYMSHNYIQKCTCLHVYAEERRKAGFGKRKTKHDSS